MFPLDQHHRPVFVTWGFNPKKMNYIQIIDDIIDLIDYRNTIKNNSYVDIENKIWMNYSWTHPHNGDDIYVFGRKATDEEVFIQQVKNYLVDLKGGT